MKNSSVQVIFTIADELQKIEVWGGLHPERWHCSRKIVVAETYWIYSDWFLMTMIYFVKLKTHLEGNSQIPKFLRVSGALSLCVMLSRLTVFYHQQIWIWQWAKGICKKNTPARRDVINHLGVIIPLKGSTSLSFAPPFSGPLGSFFASRC